MTLLEFLGLSPQHQQTPTVGFPSLCQSPLFPLLPTLPASGTQNPGVLGLTMPMTNYVAHSVIVAWSTQVCLLISSELLYLPSYSYGLVLVYFCPNAGNPHVSFFTFSLVYFLFPITYPQENYWLFSRNCLCGEKNIPPRPSVLWVSGHLYRNAKQCSDHSKA